MIKNPKVSVIIPAYDAEKTLIQCLNSVLNQNYKNYEVIVVDNNSADKTKEIIKEFQNKSKKVKYVFEEKKGRGAARNSGIKRAKGKIIVMTDSDCIVPKNWIFEITRPIIKENESAVMGSEKPLTENYWTKNIQKANSEFIKRNLKGKYISHIDTKNFAIKTSIAKKLMFDSNLGAFEDFELYLRLKKITKIKFNPSIIVGHNHKNSFVNVADTNFNRAYWTTKIYEKYKNTEFKNEVMFESILLKNFLLFPLWMVLQFIKRPIGEAFFIFVSEISWRTGLIWSLIKR